MKKKSKKSRNPFAIPAKSRKAGPMRKKRKKKSQTKEEIQKIEKEYNMSCQRCGSEDHSFFACPTKDVVSDKEDFFRKMIFFGKELLKEQEKCLILNHLENQKRLSDNIKSDSFFIVCKCPKCSSNEPKL